VRSKSSFYSNSFFYLAKRTLLLSNSRLYNPGFCKYVLFFDAYFDVEVFLFCSLIVTKE
jgi:hypothetical protein